MKKLLAMRMRPTVAGSFDCAYVPLRATCTALRRDSVILVTWVCVTTSSAMAREPADMAAPVPGPPATTRQVRELLTLLAPPFYNMSAGSDGTKDANPIIGKGNAPFCPLIPMPVQYKLDIFAKSGAGPVAVQVYSKAK